MYKLKLSNVFSIIALLCVWILLMESISTGTILSGLIFSILVLWFCSSALPLGKMAEINPFKLIVYPFVLIFQVYLAGLHVTKLVFTSATAEIVDVKTQITNESLRILLTDSLTLTPGSIVIQAKGTTLTTLWLKGKADENISHEEKEHRIKGSLEQWLIRAQK